MIQNEDSDERLSIDSLDLVYLTKEGSMRLFAGNDKMEHLPIRVTWFDEDYVRTKYGMSYMCEQLYEASTRRSIGVILAGPGISFQEPTPEQIQMAVQQYLLHQNLKEQLANEKLFRMLAERAGLN